MRRPRGASTSTAMAMARQAELTAPGGRREAALATQAQAAAAAALAGLRPKPPPMRLPRPRRRHGDRRTNGRAADSRGQAAAIRRRPTARRSTRRPRHWIDRSTVRFALAPLKALSPEQLAWATMQAVGLVDEQARHWPSKRKKMSKRRPTCRPRRGRAPGAAARSAGRRKAARQHPHVRLAVRAAAGTGGRVSADRAPGAVSDQRRRAGQRLAQSGRQQPGRATGEDRGPARPRPTSCT